ncbi:MAG: M48 family metalloprotease [Pseudomonadota bacterium]
MIRVLCLMCCLLVLPAQARETHTQEAREAGAALHAQILRQLGGEVQNPALSAYVRNIGARLVAVSSMPDAHWRFTVLNSPVINAFALPGGYMYVTRGILALANSEAELAAVMGHEIAHITEDHHAQRAARNRNANIGVIAGAVLGGLVGGKDGANEVLQKGSRFAQGYLAGHSREHEFEADKVSVTLLKEAGYDATALGDFLDTMADQKRLLAQLVGKEYDPNQVTFFSSHPATARRVAEALDLAGPPEGARFAQRYLAAIDGMIYGDAPREGFVRGANFLHPDLRFAFQVPSGFLITNSSTRVVAQGPNGAAQVFSVTGGAAQPLDRFIAEVWLPRLSPDVPQTALQNLQKVRINGLPAAQAVLPFTSDGKPLVSVLTAVAHRDLTYLFQGTAKADDPQAIEALIQGARSFRGLSEAQAAALKPYRVVAYEVQPQDTINVLSATFPMETRKRERFLILNNFDDGRSLKAGDTIKLILEQ